MDRIKIKEEKKSRPYKGPTSLLAESDLLAKAYGISWVMLVTRLLESAVEEFSVPGMEDVPRPLDRDSAGEDEKALT